jgi:glycosyltransferase involved in cell wall biosynthesis
VPRVDVCVITYQRPNSLRRLLEGIQRLEPPAPGFEVRVVIVDNDGGGSAREVCDEAAGWLRWPLVYLTEEQRGIPYARNAALAASLPEADFVAFVDDDEVPDPGWLVALLRAQDEYQADAVTGPVDPVFETPPPRWIVESGLFDAARRPTGATMQTAYTNNVLIAKQALVDMEALFDETMALIGATDSELFERFARRHRIVWCDSARASENIPPSRARLAWLVRRALRIGTSRTLVDRLRSRRTRDLARIVAHGGWCLAKGSTLALLGLARGRGAAARGLYLACVGAGRIVGLTGWAYEEYRTTHGS